MGANQVGRKHAGLRKRMALFARLRSANRALPAAASDMATAEEVERRAAALRERLAELAAKEGPAKDLANLLNSAMGDLDSEISSMQIDLLGRFDGIPFVSLRASIPRSVETHRREVIALLEVLLGDDRDLLERLPRVEYLITMLSTEEVDGRRNIIHDPTKLTPKLENFAVDSLDSQEADAVAMELYQSATLDSEAENFHEVLRSLRSRKQSIGIGCLCPAVLRAVITYNARMFNSVASLAEASRASDSLLDDELMTFDDSSLDLLKVGDDGDFVEDMTPVEAGSETGAEEKSHEDVEAESVFTSVSLGLVVDALRTRLSGGKIGRRGPGEGIAIVLDQSSLESIEREAIAAVAPTQEQNLIARTAVVGLMLLDMGPIEGFLEELAVDQAVLSDAWVRELNESFGRLISTRLADPKAYEQTSRLSGIKSKHLFKPFNALNASNRAAQFDAAGSDDASAEMRKVARAAAAATGSTKKGAARGEPSGAGISLGMSLGTNKVRVIAAAALCAIAVGLTIVNVIGISPAEIKTVQGAALVDSSPYLKSAYRNKKGRGELLIGRVDSQWAAMPIDAKIEAAETMVENFDIQGIRQAMLYNSRGILEVHFAEGQIHRPRLGDRSTGRAPGESAVRRSLTGERIDDLKAKEKAAREDDPWADEEF